MWHFLSNHPNFKFTSGNYYWPIGSFPFPNTNQKQAIHLIHVTLEEEGFDNYDINVYHLQNPNGGALNTGDYVHFPIKRPDITITENVSHPNG